MRVVEVQAISGVQLNTTEEVAVVAVEKEAAAAATPDGLTGRIDAGQPGVDVQVCISAGEESLRPEETDKTAPPVVVTCTVPPELEFANMPANVWLALAVTV